MTLFVIVVLIAVPFGAYLRWPDAWISRKLRVLVLRGWDWLAEHVLHLPPPPAPAAAGVAAAGPPPPDPAQNGGGGRRSAAPLPDLNGDAARRSAQAAVFTSTAAAQGVPAEYLQLAAAILEYDPEDDADMQAWYLQHAAGAHVLGEAWFGHVENMLNGVGIDPAFGYTAMMAAEATSDMAEIYASLAKRLVEVYALAKEHVAGGGTFPDDPNFITPDVV